MTKRTATLILTMLAATSFATSESEYMRLEEMLDAGRNWITENIDAKTAEEMQVDTEAIRHFWRKLQRRFQGQYVIELATLKEEAKLILAVLENIESARPYAHWLKTRMDYFDVVDEFKLHIPPPSSRNSRRRSLPPMEVQRKIWRKTVEKSPPPKGANNYVADLKPIFRVAGVPSQLVWLAEVESSFDPRARSPVGATGLFQFMPATARQYGLSLKPVDERLDPFKSAHAAAKYLRHLENRFDNWPLALAAYNAGEGRVSRLLKQKGANSFAQISSSLPAETQLYVPKIEATIYKREGVDLNKL